MPALLSPRSSGPSSRPAPPSGRTAPRRTALRRTAGPGSPSRRAVPRAAATLGLALAVLAACGPADAATPEAPYVADDGSYHVQVLAKDMRFDPATITVPDGRRLVVELVNTDGMPHDLVTADGAATALLGRGESATLDLGEIDGTLDAWCSVVGHREAGMVLTITG